MYYITNSPSLSTNGFSSWYHITMHLICNYYLFTYLSLFTKTARIVTNTASHRNAFWNIAGWHKRYTYNTCLTHIAYNRFWPKQEWTQHLYKQVSECLWPFLTQIQVKIEHIITSYLNHFSWPHGCWFSCMCSQCSAPEWAEDWAEEEWLGHFHPDLLLEESLIFRCSLHKHKQNTF